MGAWAGGDVKLFTALAALLPFYAIPMYPSHCQLSDFRSTVS